ncbi:MAG: universal stress protein [Bacteroidota bacterium]|nr:universal stress protein [Bacteroidota bacterium]
MISIMMAFRNILIPIDKTDNSYTGAEKALELYGLPGVRFHLINFIHTSSLMDWIKIFRKPSVSLTEKVNRAKEELKICQERMNQTHPGQFIQTDVILCKGKKQVIDKYIKQHQVDLVIAARPGNNCFFTKLFRGNGYYLHLFRNARIPLLSVLQQKKPAPIKSVLISITGQIADTKIQIALEIAKRYNAQIHIVTLLNNTESDIRERIDAFYNAFKIVSEYGYSPKYKILQGTRICEAMMQYARQIKADLILINPDKEYLSPVSLLHSWKTLLQNLSSNPALSLDREPSLNGNMVTEG